jgi:hypothetical protein
MLDLRDLLTGGAWTRDAACAWGDYERLDPIVGGRPTERELLERATAAAQLCAHCPVIRNCGADADRGGEVGVWAGSLRYRAGGDRGEYVVVPLIEGAVPSIHDDEAMADRWAHKRELVGAVMGMGEL